MSGESEPNKDEQRPSAAGAKAQSATKSRAKAKPADKGAKPKAPQAAGRRPELLTIAIASVLGAAIALGALYALEAGGLWPRAQAPGLGSLEDRVTALERATPAGGPSTDELAALRRSLVQVREDVAALEARPAAEASPDGAAATARLNDLESQIDTAESRLARLESRTPEDLVQRLESFAAAASLSEVEGRVTELETELARNDPRRAALGLGVAQLTRASRGSEPFGEELEAVALLRPDDPRIGRLAPFAETGVPTLDMLRADFPAVARRVARAAQRPEEPTAWGRVRAWFGQAISFRRTGATEGDDPSAVLARAERRLAEGNLAQAVQEMNGLPEAARAPAAEWIENAQARLNVNRLTTALSGDVIAEFERQE